MTGAFTPSPSIKTRLVGPGATAGVQLLLTAKSLELDPWPFCRSPEQLMIIVAGGEHPTHNFWLQSWGPCEAGARIELPVGWR